jgi:hypothetical protein
LGGDLSDAINVSSSIIIFVEMKKKNLKERTESGYNSTLG